MSPPTLPVSIPIQNPLPPSLLTTINTHLLTHTPSTLTTLHNTLLHECQASGWLEAVRLRARELLRSGECASYEEVLWKIIAEAKGKKEKEKEKDGVNGNGNGGGNNGNKTDVRIPEELVREGVRIVKGALEEIIEFEG